MEYKCACCGAKPNQFGAIQHLAACGLGTAYTIVWALQSKLTVQKAKELAGCRQ